MILRNGTQEISWTNDRLLWQEAISKDRESVTRIERKWIRGNRWYY